MLVAILSDIHANLEAFKAVISDLEKRQPDQVVCLGDLIGYGPDPEEVVRLFNEMGYISVMGNHEAVLEEEALRRWFNFQARENSLVTEKLLSSESLEFCRSLPRSLQREGAVFVHGFPPDSSLIYLNRLPDYEIISFLKKTDHGLFFVGHTHNLFVFCWDGTLLTRDFFGKENYRLQNGSKYIVNAGSVGQPRDGDNRAKYLLWDTENGLIEAVRISYDYKTTARKIIDRGFPADYAFRLG
jgi:predicted phosphodiesterase